MKKGDIIIFVVILFVFIGVFGLIKYRNGSIEKNSSKIYIDIYAQQELYKSIPLTADSEEVIELKTPLGKNIIKIHDGGVEMIEADCPDSICENTGFVNKMGDVIVCLPHEVLVEIRGNNNNKEKTDEVLN
ncbi:NusG domain II-containing protein [Clostridium bovifaecis]|uniref:NusG domain II-containing protein n=1 Tax=Clostridium bovifaecis TaxID=2184719 RepID=A0A6I6F9Z6_9CLOT|nr:NusG domain II-containing protein [Clostridium bovifaecis]